MYKIVEKYEGVIIDKPINVKWGNYSQIKCEMLLFKEAFEYPVNFDYYHLLSGVDLPLYLIRFNTPIIFCILILNVANPVRSKIFVNLLPKQV